MRVAFVAWRDLANPLAGGSELFVDRLARGAAAHGHEVALLCGRPTAPRPYRVVETGGTYSQYLRAPYAHARHFREWDLLVDVENGLPFFSPWWRRRPIICLLYHVHTEQWRTRFPPPVAWAGRITEERLMPIAYRSRLFAAISESTKAALVRIGVAEQQIRILRAGIDPPMAAAAERARDPVFVALGRLVPYKRIDLLLRAWRQVQPVTGGKLVVIGDGPEREKLVQQADPTVHFAGWTQEEEKWRWLRKAWLLVHPALNEGWGISVLEAASVGTPALGFDVPGVRDSIVDGRSGVLVTSEEELATQWTRLALDHSARRRLEDGASARARELTWDRTVDTFLDIAEEAVKGDSRPAGDQTRTARRAQRRLGVLGERD